MTQLYLDQKIKKVKKVRRSLRIRLEILLFHEIRAESFYNIKNGSSITTSKSLSKNLSNENKHTLCFQRIVILIYLLSWRQQKHQCLFSLLRFFDKLFDVINDNAFLTLQKTPGIETSIDQVAAVIFAKLTKVSDQFTKLSH